MTSGGIENQLLINKNLQNEAKTKRLTPALTHIPKKKTFRYSNIKSFKIKLYDYKL